MVEDCSPDSSLDIYQELVPDYPSKVKLFQHPDCQIKELVLPVTLALKKRNVN